jgi:hypothetical protein
MAQTSIIFDRCYGKVEKNLSLREREFSFLIQDFIDKNSQSLFANNPGGRVVWLNSYETKIFDICGLTVEELTLAIKSTNLNDSSWFHRNRPVYILLLLAQYYFFSKKKDELRTLSLMLIALIMYAGRQKKFFPHIGGPAFDNAMQYTINNLSNKYLLKQTGNIYKTIEATLETNNETYSKMLISKLDMDLFEYVSNLITRIHNFTKNIATEFHANIKAKNYINIESDLDPEEGKLIDRQNISMDIKKHEESCYLHAKGKTPIERNVRLVAGANSVSFNALNRCIEGIFKEESERLRVLIRYILIVFLVDQKESNEHICSSKFMLTCLRVYSKSNTKEVNVLALKDLLETLLKDHSEDFNKTQRIATKTNFKKALFMYMVTHIQLTVCSK